MFPEIMGSERTRLESPTPFTEVQARITGNNPQGKAQRYSLASELSTSFHTDIDYPLIYTSSSSWDKLPDVSLDDLRPKLRRRRSTVCTVVKVIKNLRSVCTCINRHWKIRLERQKWSQMNGRDEDRGGAASRGVGGRGGLMERDQISFSGLDMVAIAPIETGAMNQFIDIMEPPPPYDATASAYALPSCTSLPPRPLSTISSSHPSTRRETVSVSATTVTATSTIDESGILHQNVTSIQRQSPDVLKLGDLFRSPVTVRFPFAPRNQNDLEVTIGEKLRILGIFYDGWCFCQTEGGRRVEVPMACLHIPDGNEPENIPFSGTDGFTEGFPRPQVTPLYTAIVSRPFIPSRGDELSVRVGESLVVLGEIGGSWARCSRQGEVGMVPLACFDAAQIARRTSLQMSEVDFGVEPKVSARMRVTDPPFRFVQV